MLTKRENGAEIDIEVVARREEGAEIEADGVYRLVDGAEEEIWSAMEIFQELYNTLSSNVDCVLHKSELHLGTLYNGIASGYIEYVVDGNFSNPHISFDWDGFFTYDTPAGEQRFGRAATAHIHAWNVNGTISYMSAVSNMGNSQGETKGTYEKTLEGDYNRIGFRIEMEDVYEDDYDNGDVIDPLYDVIISDFKIDGKLCGYR